MHENPRGFAVVEYKAVACGHLGRFEEGRAGVSRLRELRPWWSVATIKELCGAVISPEVLGPYLDGLRKVGLPEE